MQAAVRMTEVRRWQARLDELFPAGAALEVDDLGPERFWPYVTRRPLVVDVIGGRPTIRLNPFDGPVQPGIWQLETPDPIIESTPKGARMQIVSMRWLVDPALVPMSVWIYGRTPRLLPSEEPCPELDFIAPQPDM